jgi:hypothetical protein
MASRKLAQQRVLRIMQEQSSAPVDRAPIEPAADSLQAAPRAAAKALPQDGVTAKPRDGLSA